MHNSEAPSDDDTQLGRTLFALLARDFGFGVSPAGIWRFSRTPGAVATSVVAAGAPGEPALAVPTSAITRMQGKVVGFVQHDDEHFEVHELVLGASDHRYTEIVHGLREGERVVTEGAFTIKSALLRGTFGEDEH